MDDGVACSGGESSEMNGDVLVWTPVCAVGEGMDVLPPLCALCGRSWKRYK